ncbi:MFS transporter [Streptomyces mobaraensis]|uniref:Transmembrane transport protein n=1 Tax=Streptomyces mobaraensis (strain ATCC 29032 / DSM 40847 / JCM 4168 / NBRC 13819 / NCIMB 11159 / IPCR 16-22) TaxID=1223523 RepID=M3A8Q7_STRM1|nr:transmembrane transport protein [Streptomyces mobaraensis NBRC 13819 = DSM 40847]
MYVFRLHDPFQRAQLAIVALFCSLGFQYATWAARIPALKTELGLSTAEVGVLLMAAGIGAAVSFPLVALLMKRLGSRRLALLSQLALALLLPALAAAPNYPVALLVLAVDGVCVGCLNVAMNAQGAALEARFERTAMARLHATFSGGSLLAALLASGTTAVTSSVMAHFGVAAALLVLLNASAWKGLLTDHQPGEAVKKRTRGGRRALPSRITLWMCCAMAFGTVTEGAMNDWSTLYMKDVADASAGLAPLGIAVVSGMMVVARLFADGWRDRWGDGRVVLLGSALAAAGLAFALLSGGVAAALAGFACVGLGIAAVTPCVYAAAARQGSDSLTLVAAMGTTGLLAGPPLIGFIANASGLAWGFAAVAVAAGVVSVCSTRIRWTPVSG